MSRSFKAFARATRGNLATPIEASQEMPAVPTWSTWSRNGAIGRITVETAGANDMVYAYAFNGSTKVTLGHRTGPGVMALNYSAFELNFWGLFVLPIGTKGYLKAYNGLWSEESALFGNDLESAFPDRIVIGYARSPTSATFTISGLQEGEGLACLYFDEEGYMGFWSADKNGAHSLADLLPATQFKYQFDFISLSVDGTIGLIKNVGDYAIAPVAGLSVAEKILVDIQTTLEAITEVGGFQFDVGKVTREFGRPAKGAALPYLCLEMLSDETVRVTTSTVEKIMTAGIVGWVKSSDQAPQTSLVIAEVERALHHDRTRGGNAAWTLAKRRKSTIKLHGEPKAQPYGYFEMEIEINYRHEINNPFGG